MVLKQRLQRRHAINSESLRDNPNLHAPQITLTAKIDDYSMLTLTP